MADIDVVPKRRTSSWWIWLIVAIAIIVVLWLAFGRGGSSVTNVGELLQPGATPLASAAVFASLAV